MWHKLTPLPLVNPNDECDQSRQTESTQNKQAATPGGSVECYTVNTNKICEISSVEYTK